VTASIIMASQASHEMDWYRKGDFHVVSNHDYMIYALKDSGNEWGYIVSGPEVRVIKDHRGDFFNGIQYKANYEIGETVPPSFSLFKRVAREPLGFHHQRNYGGTEAALIEAKKTCQQHFESSRVLPKPLPCGASTARDLTSDSVESLPNTKQAAG